MQTGTQKAQLGIVGNVAYQFTPNHRLSVENFYTHSGRDEGRFFEGDNSTTPASTGTTGCSSSRKG